MPGSHVQLLIEAPVILDKLSSLIGIGIDIGFYLLASNHSLGHEHPLYKFDDNIKMVME